jgi:imidazolonepropionase-like amidohydrolase
LQAATVNAAEYSGKSNDLGTVAEGKIADLVLLRANPLEDIRNTTKISAVILNGVLHDRQALDGMLHQMQERANYGK